jgi:hypothetical protein
MPLPAFADPPVRFASEAFDRIGRGFCCVGFPVGFAAPPLLMVGPLPLNATVITFLPY